MRNSVDPARQTADPRIHQFRPLTTVLVQVQRKKLE